MRAFMFRLGALLVVVTTLAGVGGASAHKLPALVTGCGRAVYGEVAVYVANTSCSSGKNEAWGLSSTPNGNFPRDFQIPSAAFMKPWHAHWFVKSGTRILDHVNLVDGRELIVLQFRIRVQAVQ